MTAIDNFGQAQNVTITVLVDNTADIIVRSTDRVKYHAGPPLLAEHGFSALIDIDGEKRILWDAGITRVGLLENIKRMEIDPCIIDTVALSHGHYDHYAAVTDILDTIYRPPDPKQWPRDVKAEDIQRWKAENRIPLIAHPAAFRERWRLQKDGNLFGPMTPPPKDMWAAAGAELILSKDPYRLADGCWTTGEIPRESFEKSGRPQRVMFREGNEFLPDDLEEDQAIVCNIKDKGLVILSGCAHSGIVNTINHARRISGIDTIWAVLGGFHLVPSDDEEMQQTINEIIAFQPVMIAPSHCTGNRAICEFSLQMPEQFVRGVVGASYTF